MHYNYFFLLEPNNEPIIHNNIANIMPENQFDILNHSTRLSVSRIIKKHIKVDINQNVIKLIGKVMKRNKDHIVALTNHNTIDTSIAGINQSTVTHGVK
jgi:hypothetical protein